MGHEIMKLAQQVNNGIINLYKVVSKTGPILSQCNLCDGAILREPCVLRECGKPSSAVEAASKLACCSFEREEPRASSCSAARSARRPTSASSFSLPATVRESRLALRALKGAPAARAFARLTARSCSKRVSKTRSARAKMADAVEGGESAMVRGLVSTGVFGWLVGW